MRLRGCCGVVGSWMREMSEQASARAKAVRLWRWEWVAECVGERKGECQSWFAFIRTWGERVGALGEVLGERGCCVDWLWLDSLSAGVGFIK